MSTTSDAARTGVAGTERAGSAKGLRPGTVGLLGSVVIGISCIAPAYTLSGALGPTVAQVGQRLPAIFLVGFLPMLLVAFGYRELNRAIPDSGTSFTWGVRAFGPWVGWMSGWGLVAATVVVLSNLAGIAVDFFYLMLSQIFADESIADWGKNPFVNVLTCLSFMALATMISYRDMQTTQKVQYVLVGFQVLILLMFAVVAFSRAGSGDADAVGAVPVSLDWFNPAGVESFSAFAAGLSLSIFIFWGWDVTLTMSEETTSGHSTPGRAATLTIVLIVLLYLVVGVAAMRFAGFGTLGTGLGNEEIQENVFFALAGPVLGPLAILMSIAVLSSSFASLQSTFVSPARTLLAMGHYGAISPKFARVSPRFFTPGYATLVSAVVASVFYAVMRFVSEAVLWDTITTLGMLICFYYGLTAFSAVWYFRRQWFAGARSFVFQLLFPLVGAIILATLFVTTLRDSMDPQYGSGSEVFGVGLVFVLGIAILLIGVVLMLISAARRPAFFRGETIPVGVAGDAGESRVGLEE
ncbi:MAG TPA: APC family permease [Dermatophilaceae bacterium]|nr:APC family permease [Dermatophilaceae bacterium]